MKKIIPVALVLVLALALMIVPAFADTVYTGIYDPEMESMTLNAMPPAGQYHLVYSGGAYLGSYDGIITLTENAGGRLVANLSAGDPSVLFYKLMIDSSLNVSISYENGGGEGGVYPTSLTLTPVSPAPDQPVQSAALTDFLDVVSGVGTWLITALTSVTALFYTAESGLTLLGVLCVVPLGLGLIFLLVFTIVNWLRFRS